MIKRIQFNDNIHGVRLPQKVRGSKKHQGRRVMPACAGLRFCRNSVGRFFLGSLIACTVLLFLTFSSVAQARSGTATLYGIVDHNNTPLGNTVVSVIGEATYTSRSAITNENGVYVIEGLLADEYIIHAVPMPEGVYRDGVSNVVVENGKEKEVNFSLQKK